MKPTFHVEIVNDPFEDPVLYVRAMYHKTAFLFDLGNIDSLGPGKINTINKIFVTHMHIDHFIGFDTVLRFLLKRDTPLCIYGPEGITNCIDGKLKGYTWNLIKDYPFRLEVYEVDRHTVRQTSFYASEGFTPIIREPSPFTNPIVAENLYRVNTLVLSHQIPVLAYSLEENMHININKQKLIEKRLEVGPWLNTLKKMILEDMPQDTILYANDRQFQLGDLLEICMISRGQKICYVMDISPTDENLQLLRDFLQGADVLYCEAFFSDDDIQRAMERNHLTAGMAGRLAREAGVRILKVMHFSQKYKSDPNLLISEAEAAFKGS
ncbi:MAG: ribonuclease Z [Thermodesulfovibrionales bacterium]